VDGDSYNVKDPEVIRNPVTGQSDTFEYNELHRTVDLNLLFSLGYERVMSQKASFYWSITYRHGLFNAERFTDSAVEKINSIGGKPFDHEKKYRSADIAIGFNFYPHGR